MEVTTIHSHLTTPETLLLYHLDFVHSRICTHYRTASKQTPGQQASRLNAKVSLLPGCWWPMALSCLLEDYRSENLSDTHRCGLFKYLVSYPVRQKGIGGIHFTIQTRIKRCVNVCRYTLIERLYLEFSPAFTVSQRFIGGTYASKYNKKKMMDEYV